MRFELHNKHRFDVSCSEEDYQKAKGEYFAHLRKINFNNRRSLVRYFGDSFFHDANLNSMAFGSNNKSFTLTIFSANSLEDINNFRINNKLRPISYKQYVKNPIQYKCLFKKVSKILFSRTINLSNGLVIMDTELDINKNGDEFIVRLSFWDAEEMEIHFKGQVIVKVDNDQLVSKYLNRLRKTIPYCATCKSRMLSPSNAKI
jgi:hypothetical protein